MQSISNEQVADMLRFVERQTVFVLETTADVKTYHDFLPVWVAWCFSTPLACAYKQLVKRFVKWMILLREISLSFIHQPLRLVPLLTDLRHVLADIDNVLQEKPKEGEKK